MAFKQHSRAIPEELISKIAHQIENLENKIMSVEEIQDLVVKKLMASSEKDIAMAYRSEEHTSELQSRQYLVCRLLLEKKIVCRLNIVKKNSENSQHTSNAQT